MYESEALPTQGTKFEILTALPSTYTEIKEVNSFSGLDGKASVIDVTHLQSAAKEKRKGLQDFGSYKMQTNYLPSDEGQAAMRTAQASDDAYTFRITLVDGTTIVFDAFVMSSPMEGGVDAKVGGSFEIEITGAIQITPPDSSDS